MEFGEKCAVMMMESRKRERIEQPNQKTIRTLGEKEKANSTVLFFIASVINSIPLLDILCIFA